MASVIDQARSHTRPGRGVAFWICVFVNLRSNSVLSAARTMPASRISLHFASQSGREMGVVRSIRLIHCSMYLLVSRFPGVQHPFTTMRSVN